MIVHRSRPATWWTRRSPARPSLNRGSCRLLHLWPTAAVIRHERDRAGMRTRGSVSRFIMSLSAMISFFASSHATSAYVSSAVSEPGAVAASPPHVVEQRRRVRPVVADRERHVRARPRQRSYSGPNGANSSAPRRRARQPFPLRRLHRDTRRTSARRRQRRRAPLPLPAGRPVPSGRTSMSSAAICSGVARRADAEAAVRGDCARQQTDREHRADDESRRFMRGPSAGETNASIGAIVQPVTGLR
jgi:hypothetical protein